MFFVIYLLSGVGGTALSACVEYLREDYAISAGASGAIFGLTGALLCLTLDNDSNATFLSVPVFLNNIFS